MNLNTQQQACDRRNGQARRSIYKVSLALGAALLITPLLTACAWSQGCILARSPEQSGLPTSEGGVLQPGHFQISIGERHQYSYQHYVGDVYQEYRAQAKTQVENRINLVTANLTYQISPRVSVEIDAPCSSRPARAKARPSNTPQPD